MYKKAKYNTLKLITAKNELFFYDKLSKCIEKPQELWETKFKPFFKKGKKTDPSNYRPISLLPLISKVLERVIYDQTNAFLKGNNLLYNYQSGFRTNHSTNLCLSFLTDKILKGFDEGLLTGMILIDLQKAFDTIMKFFLKN